MNATARVRSAGTWAGALGALLVCGLLIPSQARAGCSHYVIHRAALGDAVGTLDPSIRMPAVALPDEAPGTDGPRRPAPCSGPSCSGRSDAPTPPPVSTTRFVEAWACLAEPWIRSGCDVAMLDASSHRLRPIHLGEPNPRPPRSIRSCLSPSIG